MNRIFTIIYIFTFSLFALSCSKDEAQEESNTTNPLIGTWYQIEVVGEKEGLNDCEKKSYYTFSEQKAVIKQFQLDDDKKCVAYFDGEFTYSIEGTKIKSINGSKVTKIPFNVNQNLLTLFQPQSNDTFVEI